MAAYRSSGPKTGSQVLRGELLLPVGWRAFVHWPIRAGERTESVPLANGTSAQPANDLSDGQEVEILAWRPFASGGLSYQIKRLHDGAEFWVRALYLRRTKKEAPPA